MIHKLIQLECDYINLALAPTLELNISARSYSDHHGGQGRTSQTPTRSQIIVL